MKGSQNEIILIRVGSLSNDECPMTQRFKEKIIEVGGQDWTYAALSQGTPVIATATRS